MTSIGRQRQNEIFTSGIFGQRLRIPVSPGLLKSKALTRMSGNAVAYFGGAGLERTMSANRAAFDRHRIVPRMLQDVSRRDLSVELFGRILPLPFLLGPIGVLELAHRDADLAAARAASARGIPFVTSSQASRPLEMIAEAIGDGPRWFQLYWSSSDELTESFVLRAEDAGYEAIVLTLDITELGWRPRDLDRGYLPLAGHCSLADLDGDHVGTIERNLLDPSSRASLSLEDLGREACAAKRSRARKAGLRPGRRAGPAKDQLTI